MNWGWRDLSWWQWLLAALAVAAVVYVGFADGLSSAIATVVGIAAAVFALGNPFEARPKPTLKLQPLGQDPETKVTLGAGLRPVDVDAIVESARERAMAAVPHPSIVMFQQYAKPTEKDHEMYEADVEVYLEQVRSWAEAAERRMREHSTVLVANVIQSNSTSVDAEDAGVSAVFPVGTKEYARTDDPLHAPEAPAFPVRKSALALLSDPVFGPRLGQRVGLSLRESLVDRISEAELASFRDAAYEPVAGRGLRVSYRRQPIRHREEEASGRPLEVRLPEGEHDVSWHVHARNMAHPVSGTWKVSCQPQPSGDPITTVSALEAALEDECAANADVELFPDESTWT